jgi:hypothetical protein
MRITELFEQGAPAMPMGTGTITAPTGSVPTSTTTVSAPTAQTTTDPKFAAAQAAANKKQRDAQRQAIMKQIADLQKQLSQLTRTV